jgi:hypothetical protein
MALPRIFLSHSHKDYQWCEQLVDALQRTGFDVWFDKQGLYVGALWVKKLEDELQHRDVFLIVLTPDSWASEWVQEELSLALGLRKQIMGIIHKGTTVSGFITNRQLLDAVGKTAEQAAGQIATVLGGVSLEQQVPDPSRKRGGLLVKRRASLRSLNDSRFSGTWHSGELNGWELVLTSDGLVATKGTEVEIPLLVEVSGNDIMLIPDTLDSPIPLKAISLHYLENPILHSVALVGTIDEGHGQQDIYFGKRYS